MLSLRKLSFFLVLGLSFLFKPACGQDMNPGSVISEERFVLINGIEQWITIHGNSAKPAVLFLHGGPGSVLSPYSRTLFRDWENDFLLIQWDQRGAGRTYGKNAPVALSPEFLATNPLKFETYINDGLEITRYLLKYLHREKLILFGTSWGSAVGIPMVTQRPDLFHAYIGHSQLLEPYNDVALFDRVVDRAESSGDSSSLKSLALIGRPPYERAKNLGQLMRLVKKLEKESSQPAPQNWFVLPAGYDNKADEMHREEGDDYSFVNFAGDKPLGVTGMRDSINFFKSHTVFSIPVYFIQGQHDLLTPPESTTKFYELIKAPMKKLILVPGAAHGFNQEVLAALQKILKELGRS